ncbi:PREDICTED: pyruvate dehydrogenase [acetyl-transferring]-phosphatase 1, mitochondrial-like [Amphimedon queenslandica]|uniref:PPM-type phosphatase domain-containing protein n=1 Tax=Amphimedon queenslandica TaxID=400682 RepID=A0A1X7VDE2_AMPQE|nr:PREDICTED: pyruvate dehydrogenase [acetyl-transferring]-phosphatase 1, mitochondrial-like [Amphimedon queenslandica]|eukprot:XP_003384612.2 PREDICTED: pyruvate dehydrogenase [acetyl-transferring]-phosphatase 1, mitochondrial-like [Amphimedon queenslandica]
MFYLCLCLFIVSMAAYRLTRRRIFCLAGVCSGLATSGCLLLLVKEESVSCRGPGQCRHLASLSYQTLRKNEFSFKVNHPHIRSVDINYLPSNSPNEDRYSFGGLPESSAGLFAVIDGHRSFHCAEFLRQNLLKHVTQTLREGGVVSGSLNIHRDGDTLLDAGGTESLQLPDNSDKVPSLLRKSFLDLDKNISDGGLEAVELVKKGHSIRSNEGIFAKLAQALSGACALFAMINPQTIYVASTGDCRAVLGKKAGSGWEPVALSKDQNVHNEEEVNRVKSAHPGEEDTVIRESRLLGGLMPFRAFGDTEYKWPEESLSHVHFVLGDYKTPPYLTAEPVVTSYPSTGGQFLILGTDGLWERMKEQDIIDVVGRHYDKEGNKDKTSSKTFGLWSSKEKTCCEESVNSATELLWESLGGSDRSVKQLLEIPAGMSRMYRDDITIIVIHFK